LNSEPPEETHYENADDIFPLPEPFNFDRWFESDLNEVIDEFEIGLLA
jgi:hypothetical protein